MRFKFYFTNPDAPETGMTVEVSAASVEEAREKGKVMPSPGGLLGLEDIFVLEESASHLAGTTREEWRSIGTSAGMTTIREI